jgi:hypothetical protein
LPKISSLTFAKFTQGTYHHGGCELLKQTPALRQENKLRAGLHAKTDSADPGTSLLVAQMRFVFSLERGTTQGIAQIPKVAIVNGLDLSSLLLSSIYAAIVSPNRSRLQKKIDRKTSQSRHGAFARTCQ